jgi:hydrogenase nickel incorporation protein HypA/HybF
MHEFSLMQGILDSVTPVARQHGAERVTGIALDIGVMTQVVEECLTFAFDTLTEDDPLYNGAKLTLNFITPKSRCLDCGTEFEHDRFHLKCPECGSPATMVLQGKEMHIASIDVDTPDD